MYTKTVDETEIPVVDLILEAYNQADVGKYAEALAKIKAAKSVDPRNIYIIALEKQFAKLLSLPAGTGADEARETLPGLLDRALDSARKNHGAPAGPAPAPAGSGVKSEQEARLKEVRDQYFSRADEFVERGDYESALAEVKRVAIIDPDNRIAREYEEKISQLAGIGVPSEPVRSKAAPDEGKAAPAPQPGTTKEASHLAPEPQPGPLPQPHGHQAESSAAPVSPKAPKSKMVMITAIAAVVVLGLGAAYFLTRSTTQSGSRLVYSLGDAQKTYQASVQVQVTQSKEGATTTIVEAPPVEEKAAPETPATPAPKSSAKEETRTTKASVPAPSKSESKSETPSKPVVQPPTQPVATPPAAETKAPETNQTPAQPFVAVEKEPKIVKLEAPKLPEVASRAGLTGRVIVKVQIDTKGKPTQAVILTSTNHVFDEAVITAVMNSKFEPGMMSSGPVSTWMAIPYVFK